MTKLTEEEIKEPNVTLRIPIEKWNELPEEATNLLRLFIRADHINYFVVNLPAYRWREVQAIVAAAGGQADHDGQ